MVGFRDLTIRTKIALVLMGTASLAVLLACLGFYSLVLRQYTQAYRGELESLARVVGVNCRAALAFEVVEDAEKILSSLSNHPSILSATIKDKNGREFARYDNPRATILPAGVVGAAVVSGYPRGAMIIAEEIRLDGSMLGEVTFVDDMRQIHDFNRLAGISLIVIIGTVLALTYLIAARVSAVIAHPIIDLAALSREVSSHQDYTLRAVKKGADEVGDLTDAFNSMLSQIAGHNREIRESERRFRSLINQAVDAFFLHDMDGRFVDANPRACDILGYSREELLELSVLDVGSDSARYGKRIWRTLSADRPMTIETSYRRRDNSILPVEARVGLLEIGEQRLIMVLARDISERLRAEAEKHYLESQLQQAQKMESIGTLAGGIAHDFNNILTPIFGYLEMAMLTLPETSKGSIYLHEVMKAANRARELVGQILLFSRKEKQQPQPVEMHIIVKEALKLIRASIPTTIEIRQEIDGNCGPVLANPTQIHQIIMNLCTNAYHAMRENGGVLDVALGRRLVAPEEVKEQGLTLTPGQYLLLEVRDTGHGMDKETLLRIFEPYFTTKGKGEGTGMGLAVVHGIVKSHGGHVEVESEPGKGTTFRVYLPEIQRGMLRQEREMEATLVGGTESLLLVDDEAAITESMKMIFTDLGYRATATTDPETALRLFREDPQQFDLMITDMTMPRMTGDLLASQCLAIRPGFPVILCTGFSDLIDEDRAKALGLRKFVNKPFTRKDLATVVRRVLDEGRGG